MVGACLLLAGSGAVRLWQEWRYAAAFENAETPPFLLREMPREFGDWINKDGDQTIDKDTLTIAGSSDYLARQYVNEKTGVSLMVLVVFGPAERVFNHAPTACFPAIGYSLAEADPPREFPLPGVDGGEPTTATFASAVYSKSNGNATADRVECFWSFWHDGIWSADAARTKKLFRHHPEMFKVQVQRQVGPIETRSGNNPAEKFLEEFLPELQRRIAKARGSTGQSGQAAAE
jgi:hypothetical protein